MRFLLILFLTLNLLQAKKIALLIGNSDYDFARLANPLHDVDGIYKTLKEIGFDDIKVLKNASKTEMENALLHFEEKAQSAEIALIYFSGHGMQVNNINYMFPARTTVTKPIHLKKLVDLDMFIESASSAKYGIILVDACRDNPLVKYFQNGKYKGASAKKGLGQVTPNNGEVIIGFATGAGKTADDGKGNMSPYASALSKWLKVKDDIRNILGKVSKEVSKRYNQRPIYGGYFTSNVYLSKNNHKIPEFERVEEKFSNIESKVNNLKWITPTKSTCIKNGGYFFKKKCYSNWMNAKSICKANKSVLPTREALKKVIIDCGGKMYRGSAFENEKNQNYQSCYKQKGFVSTLIYWSSESYKINDNNAWGIGFGYGVEGVTKKSIENHVRCIK